MPGSALCSGVTSVVDSGPGSCSVPSSDFRSCFRPNRRANPGHVSPSSSSSGYGVDSARDSSVCSGSSSSRALSLGPCLGPSSRHINDSCAGSSSSPNPGPSSSEVADVSFGSRSRHSPNAGSRSDPNSRPRHICPRPKPHPNTSSSSTRGGEDPKCGSVCSSSNSSRKALALAPTLCPGASNIVLHPFFAARNLKRKRRVRDVAPPPFAPKAKRIRSGVYKPTRSTRTPATRKRKRGHNGCPSYSIESYIHRTKRLRSRSTNPSLLVEREDATRADNNHFSES